MRRERFVELVLCAVLTTLAPLSSARADYLEVRRDSLLKKQPQRAADTLERLAPGVLLHLIPGEQHNGYYAVKSPHGQRGFVYRTFVRRHRGEAPIPATEPKDHAAQPTEPDDSAPGPDREDRLDAATFDDLATAAVPTMRVHLINVGQGAATLLEFSCGAVLVDTGGESNGEFDSASALRGNLEAFFDRRQDLNRTLDLLVISHPHLDHVLNVQMVAETFVIKNVVTNGITTGSGGYQQQWLQTWAARPENDAHLDIIELPEVQPGGISTSIIDPLSCSEQDPALKVLWGALETMPADFKARFTDEELRNANNHSVVVRLDFGKASFLFSGDLEVPAIRLLIEKHRDSRALDVDVWQVSHHGSANGVSDALLPLISPAIALLPTGSPERQVEWSAWAHGHPRKVVIDALLHSLTRPRLARRVPVALGQERFRQVRISEAIYATGWDGSVVVTANAEGEYEVRTER